MPASIFMTGATGFAGSVVVQELVRSGRAVTALVRGSERIEGCQTVVGDLETIDRLAQDIGRCEGIVHLASPRSLDREVTINEDILGTGGLVDAWRSGPFVYASTTTIHGIPRSVIDQNAPIDLLEWYDTGKVVNEFQIRAAAGSERRGPAISLRPTIFIGTGPRARDRQMIAMILDACRAGATFVFETEAALETSGAAFLGLPDFARAVSAALDLKASGAYPIAGEFARWRDVIDAVNQAAGSKGRYIVRADGAQGSEVRLAHSRTELDSSAFESATGWKAQESVSDLVGTFVHSEAVLVA